MRREDFVARYGGIYEHSPWVAEAAFDEGGSGTLASRLAAVVDAASRERKLALIRAHPDLAGRAAIAGELTESSSEEQRRARLDLCTPGEFERFHALNRQYRDKFGFPFVLAVRNRNREEILEAFEMRLGNDAETEFDTAIREIHEIARLRLEAI
ncbi:MAG: 2-oxo-4-hydroxy-4-carboxy-5-ureidoimidazoline decarboxylase [Gammaproteobacteria bacterium]|nr:2-oxo-4-hydroxy-4-carboxy-5-ureidoimidazoline decarboxylase [Gammaproteobacteria bacterium]